MKPTLTRISRVLRGRDRGTVAVTFLLSLPLLLLIYAMIVQIALIANAKITLTRAAHAAARSAMVSLPTDPLETTAPGFDAQANIRRSANLVLTSISPRSPAPTQAASDLADDLQQVLTKLPAGFARRYTYADAATTVNYDLLSNANTVVPTWSTDRGYPQTAGAVIRLSITYRLYLNVPAASLLIGQPGTIAGLDGRFLTMTSTVDVPLSNGRQVPTNASGEP